MGCHALCRELALTDRGHGDYVVLVCLPDSDENAGEGVLSQLGILGASGLLSLVDHSRGVHINDAWHGARFPI